MAPLRAVLAAQVVGLAGPVALPFYLLVLLGVTHPQCANDSGPCLGPTQALIFITVFSFGPPLWWVGSAAWKLPRLKARQLAWIIVVDVWVVAASALIYAAWLQQPMGLNIGGWDLIVVLLQALLLLQMLPAMTSIALCALAIRRLRAHVGSSATLG